MNQFLKKLMKPSKIVYRAADYGTKEDLAKLKEIYPSFKENITLEDTSGFLKTNLFPYFYSMYGNEVEQDVSKLMMDMGFLKSVKLDFYNKENDEMKHKYLPFISFKVLDTPSFTNHLSVLPEYSSNKVDVLIYIEFQNEYDVLTRIVLKQSIKGNVRSFISTMTIDDVLDEIVSTEPSDKKGFLPFGYKVDQKGGLSFVQFDPMNLQQEQIFLDVYTNESLKDVLGDMVSKVSVLIK